MNTIDVIQDITKSSVQIEGINIHSYPDVPQLQDRLSFNDLENYHYDNALKLRQNDNIPFWDALMLSFYNKKQFSVQILENVLNNHASRTLELIPRKEVLKNRLVALTDTTVNYAINSKIISNEGKIRHLILLDFHIPESSQNQKVVEEVLKILKVKNGYLINSGKSYHFFGQDLIAPASLTKFLGRCLFFTPIIDKTWIAHQLMERSCSIRFTKKNGYFPTVIKKIEF